MKNNNNSQFNPLHHRLAYIDASLRHAFGSITAVRESLDCDRQADGALAAELFNLENVLNQLERHMPKLTPNAAEELPATTGEHSESGAAAERNLLLRALDAQEARIRQLELELETLRASAAPPLKQPETADDEAAPELLSKRPLQADAPAARMIVAIQDGGNLKVGLHRGITTIGREPQNDLQIRSRFVSRFHARIVSDDTGAVIEDLDSRNGITVNAEQVKRRQLRSGDYLRIGRVQLQYIDIMEGGYGGDA